MFLSEHNTYRASHQAPAVTWDQTIADTAQSWAEGCSFTHATGTGYGESLAWGNLNGPADVGMVPPPQLQSDPLACLGVQPQWT